MTTTHRSSSLIVGPMSAFTACFARDEALARGKIFRGMAIEPDPINQKRLAFNLAASGCPVRSFWPRLRLAGRIQRALQFVSAVSNRGGVHDVLTGKESLPEGAVVSVPTRPLLDLLREHGFDHIDVMKIDVEGHEIHALEPFFQDGTERPVATQDSH